MQRPATSHTVELVPGFDRNLPSAYKLGATVLERTGEGQLPDQSQQIRLVLHHPRPLPHSAALR